MTSAAPDQNDVPKPALLAIGAVLVLAIVGAAIGRHSPHGAPAAAVPIGSRLLRFADLPDGRVGVTDPATGGTVAVLAREQDSFIRASVRDMARSRDAAGVARGDQFRLTAWEDGRLTLASTADGSTMELEAFGPTNEAAFARLLTAEETPR